MVVQAVRVAKMADFQVSERPATPEAEELRQDMRGDGKWQANTSTS
jgi:hypothetical protein